LCVISEHIKADSVFGISDCFLNILKIVTFRREQVPCVKRAPSSDVMTLSSTGSTIKKMWKPWFPFEEVSVYDLSVGAAFFFDSIFYGSCKVLDTVYPAEFLEA